MNQKGPSGLNKVQRTWLAEKVLTPLALAPVAAIILQVFRPGQTVDVPRVILAFITALILLWIAGHLLGEEE